MRNHELDTPDPREGRLPVWARDRLARERRARRDAEALAERATLKTDPAASGALLGRFDDLPIGLGADPYIAFRCPFPGYSPPMSFIEVRLLRGRPGINLNAPDEIVCRTRAINSIDVVPWPK